MTIKKGSNDKETIVSVRNQKIKEVIKVKNFLKGSLVETLTKCGNPNCRCSKGQRHNALHLSFKTKGKTRRVYIPRGLEGETRQWLNNRKELLSLLEEIFQLNLIILKDKDRK